MKTLKSLVIVLAVALSSATVAKADKAGKASAELSVQIVAQLDGKVLVGFEKLAEEKVFIKIYNSAGELVHTEKVTESTIVLKRFDLSGLPAGKYSYTVSNDLYSVSKTIEKK